MSFSFAESDIADFARRHRVAAATSADAMSERLSEMFAPYQITPLQRSGAYEATLASTTVRSIRISTLSNRHETVGKAIDDNDSYSVTFSLKGEAHTWLPGLRDEIATFGEFGRVFQRRSGTVTIDGEDMAVVNLWVPRSAIQSGLQQILGDTVDRPVTFQPRISNRSGAGATLFRSMMMAVTELADPDTSFTHPMVAVRFEEFVVHTLLYGVPHNFSDILTAQRSAAAPRCVIKALEYIKAHASDPLTISQIAGAAGCSTRALQLAFRAWRDTTPMKELNRVRLEYAHTDLLKLGLETTVTQVALKWGFGHPGRFAQQYLQVMGQSPSQTQRFGMITTKAAGLKARAK